MIELCKVDVERVEDRGLGAWRVADSVYEP